MKRPLTLVLAVLLAGGGLALWIHRAHDPVARVRMIRVEKPEADLQIPRLKSKIKQLRSSLRADERALQITLQAPYLPLRRKGPVAGRHRWFVPHDATAGRLVTIPARGTLPPEIVAAWWRGPRSYRDPIPLEGGLVVWQPRRLPAPSDPWSDSSVRWRPVFEIDIPTFHGLPAFVGRPGRLTGEYTYGEARLRFSLGDVTGDGYPEVLVADWSSGSGGCAMYRILSATPGGVHQILHRNHCEGPLEIIDGSVRISGAVSPKGCDSAHGCGSIRKTLRWNGDGWDLVTRHVKIDRADLRYYRHH